MLQERKMKLREDRLVSVNVVKYAFSNGNLFKPLLINVDRFSLDEDRNLTLIENRKKFEFGIFGAVRNLNVNDNSLAITIWTKSKSGGPTASREYRLKFKTFNELSCFVNQVMI